MLTLKGTGLSRGSASGRLVLRKKTTRACEERSIAQGEVEAEASRFFSARDAYIAELEGHAEAMRRAGKANEAVLFDGFREIAGDESMSDEILERIRTRLESAGTAVAAVAREYVTDIESVSDPYLRERSADMASIFDAILRNLSSGGEAPFAEGPECSGPHVLAASELAPQDLAGLDRAAVLGLALERGSLTSHVGILARSLGFPAVAGLKAADLEAADGSEVILDADSGLLIVEPDRETEARYARERSEREGLAAQDREAAGKPALTREGKRITLMANVGSPKDVAAALEKGAEGIGLFRTEFVFMGRSSMPTEEEQFEAYRQVIEGMGGREVVIRTVDIGGDKGVPYFDMGHEDNPFLGWRSIRYCLDNPEVFKTQLRAILRAAAYGSASIMLPMITSREEIRAAKALLAEAGAELDARGAKRPLCIKVGIMVETPAAAILSGELAEECDFFSIGTNDLTQYVLAADRCNPRVAGIYRFDHPAVLACIKTTVAAALAAGKGVSMCGEMAGDPRFTETASSASAWTPRPSRR
jgi:phosphotransferase system enzyme I (PtsI)